MRILRWLLRVLLGLSLTVYFSARRWLRRYRRAGLYILAVAALLWVSPYVIRAIPSWIQPLTLVPPRAIVALIALSLFALTFTALFYILFRFLWTLATLEMQIAAEFKQARQAVAKFFTSKTKEQAEGNFIPYSDERQAEVEAMNRLKEEGMLTDEQIEDYWASKTRTEE